MIVAAAGSGKTRLIINDVIENPKKRILITTFTLANEQSIRRRLVKANRGVIPENVNIQPWFSFLLEHGVRPYRFWDERVYGMKFVSTPLETGVRYIEKIDGKDVPVIWSENGNFNKHYFTNDMKVYSDKLSKLVTRCNKKSSGSVIKRLENIYERIYIDEVQDMAGYDLEIIKLLLKSKIHITMVGDPRQTVYQTHHERKHEKYAYGKIKEFILTIPQKKKTICVIDEETLQDSYRNSESICALSSKLYAEYNVCRSLSKKTHSHTGIFFVQKKDIDSYGKMISPLQLRLNRNRTASLSTPVMNFGESKGLEEEHVLIYPTDYMLEWLNSAKIKLEPKTKSQLYIALTRAFFSVGIVVEDTFVKKTNEIQIWNPDEK